MNDMDRADRNAQPSASADFSRDELIRYERHFSMPEFGVDGQRRLRQSSVLVVGAGGLGSPATMYLAAAGVGRLGLVDDDRVELSNLQRQILHDTRAVGTSKLDSARSRLEGLNPHVEVRTFESRLYSGNALEILGGWDFVVDGSDNFPTRYLVNDACVLLGIPFAYGAILRFEGQASLFGEPGGPCYRCLFREPPPPALAPNCAEAGVLGVLPGIVGSIQANEAIKWLAGVGDTLAGRLLLIDALRMEFRSMQVARDPECAVCGTAPTVTSLIDYERFCGRGTVAGVEPARQGARDSAAGDDGAAAGIGTVAGTGTTGAGGRGVARGAETDSGEDAVNESAMDDLHIDVHELQRWIESGQPLQLIDVREDYEWAICNLAAAGARLIPMAALPEAADTLDKSKRLVVHCRTGPRGERAVEYLRALGFEDAVNLAGGIHAWAREIDPSMSQY